MIKLNFEAQTCKVLAISATFEEAKPKYCTYKYSDNCYAGVNPILDFGFGFEVTAKYHEKNQ